MTDETFPLLLGSAVEEVEGRDDSLMLILAYGTLLPLQGPDGQAVPLQLGLKRFVLPRESVEQIISQLTEKVDGLRRQSNIPVATNMSEVEAAAQRLQDMQNGR